MKKMFIVLIVVIIMFVMTACNYQIVDTTYNYTYAIIKLQNGEVIEGDVDSWKDYENSDQLQITINGVTYLEHAINVDLMTEKPQ